MSKCDCQVAGCCPRHQMEKSEHLLHLCRTRDDYRNLWDQRVGIQPDPGEPFARTATCAYRGPAVRRQQCETCSGHVEVKVLACAVHSECTIGKRLEGLACC